MGYVPASEEELVFVIYRHFSLKGYYRAKLITTMYN